MGKFNNQPGVITKILKKIPDEVFENGILITLILLISLLPLKMIYILSTNDWEEYIYATYESSILFIGIVIATILLAKKIIVYGFSYIIKQITFNKSYIFFAGFAVCICLASLFADDPHLAFYSNLHRNEGAITFYYYIFTFLMAGIIKNSKKKRILLNVFAVSATLLCSITILQRYDVIASFFNKQQCVLFASTGKYESIFCYFNHYGYYLCMAVLCCAGLIFTDEKKKCLIGHTILMGVNVWSLVLNDTFGSYIAAVIALLIITLLFMIKIVRKHEKWSKWMVVRIALPFLLFVIVSCSSSLSQNSISTQMKNLTTDMEKVVTAAPTADSAGTGRWHLWKITAGFIAERPVFGYGAEGLIDKYAAVGLINDRPANEYLQYAAFFGIPGLLFYILALMSILLRNIKKLKTINPITLAVGGCVLAYAISACFGNTMYYTTVYFYMFLGLVSRD